jgi:hypothetical protein
MFHHDQRILQFKFNSAKHKPNLWKFNNGGPVDSPVVAGGVVYAGSLDGKVYALDAFSGALTCSYVASGPVVSSPAVAGGIVYAGSYDHLVYAFGSSPNEQTCSVFPSLIVLSLFMTTILLVAVLLVVALYKRRNVRYSSMRYNFLPFSHVSPHESLHLHAMQMKILISFLETALE